MPAEFPEPPTLVPALRAAPAPLWHLVQLMYYSLARPGELVQLRAHHVRAEVVEIPAAISKTRRARFVTITPALRLVLDELLTNTEPNTLLLRRNGRPVQAGPLSVAHLAVVRRLGLGAAATLYCWKHTGVVDMYRAGVKERYIKEQGGWASGRHFDTYLRNLGLYAAEELIARAPTL